MRHDITISGHTYGLRPVGRDDSEFIVGLRGLAARARYVHRSAASIDAQNAWMDAYFERPGDYYFLVHHLASRRCEGTVGIYDVDASSFTAEWGRWILAPDSLAAVESVLLLYRVAFERLQLRCVYSRTLADNVKVVSFHDSCGIRREAEPLIVMVDGERRQAIEHRLRSEEWPALGVRLESMARRLSRRTRTG